MCEIFRERELVLNYFRAFSVIYTIISMKRAWRIIKNQNPELTMTEEEFREFVEKDNFDNEHFIIEYDEEMYSDEPSTETDTMKKFLIAEFLYEVDDITYDEMKSVQEGYRFYVPEKENLLKYSDEYFCEKNDEFKRFTDFMLSEYHLSEERVEVITIDMIGDWRALTESISRFDVERTFDELYRLTRRKFSGFTSNKKAERFSKLYADLFNSTRLPMYRWNTPAEVNMAINEEFIYEIL